MKQLTQLVAMATLVASLTAPAVVVAAEHDESAIVLTDHSMRSSKLIGRQVYNDQGQGIGTVQEVLVKNGAETMVVLSVGDFVGGGPRMVAVPLSHLDLDHGKPMMSGATKQMLAGMPVFVFPPDMNQHG
jgi:hypothetical protein